MATRVRVERVKTGLNLKEFAETHRLPYRLLSRIELGREYIPPAMRPTLAAALGIAERDICDERGWPVMAS